MNKNAIILISLGAMAFLTALFLINNRADNNAQTNIDNSATPAETVPFQEAMQQVKDETIRGGINENEIVYTIAEGEVTYGANKQFLSKDAENVIGRTEDVQGNGYWNKETSEVDASVAVNLATLATGNEKRDTDIQPLFTDKMATFRLEPTKVDMQMGQDFEADMTGTMTLNGQSQQVTFKAKGNITETTFNIEGTSNIKMSDFGISAPSMAGIFTVADELPISFKIAGEAVAAAATE